MSNKRSINQRLTRGKSPETKLEIVLDWVDSWQKDHENGTKELGKAIQSDDFDALCITAGRLKELNLKRIEALPEVFKQILGQIEEK